MVSGIDADGKVYVLLENGVEHLVEPTTWRNYKYAYNEEEKRIEEEIIGTFEQLPLRLAWAITAAGDVDYDLSFGCDSNGDESYVSGEYDECRLMDGVASADWVKAEYDTVKNAAFLTYGEAEAAAVDPTLALGKPSVRNALVNAAEINVMVRGIGVGASSVTLKCLYGELPDQLTTEQAAESLRRC